MADNELINSKNPSCTLRIQKGFKIERFFLMISGKSCCYDESRLLLRTGTDTNSSSFQRTQLASLAAGGCSGLISGIPHLLTQILKLAILFRERICWENFPIQLQRKLTSVPFINQTSPSFINERNLKKARFFEENQQCEMEGPK